MARAIAGDATRSHFASLSNKLRKHSKIFVIDPERLVSAKATYFPAKHRPPAWSAFVIVRPFTIGSRPTFHLCHRLLPFSFLNLRCDSVQEFTLKFMKPSCRNDNKKFVQHHSGASGEVRILSSEWRDNPIVVILRRSGPASVLSLLEGAALPRALWARRD